MTDSFGRELEVMLAGLNRTIARAERLDAAILEAHAAGDHARAESFRAQRSLIDLEAVKLERTNMLGMSTSGMCRR